jgi:hypothetical protein
MIFLWPKAIFTKWDERAIIMEDSLGPGMSIWKNSQREKGDEKR